MIERWFAPASRRGGSRPDCRDRPDRFDRPDRRDAHYECSYCQANVAEWTEDCPRCGQLVVRVVELSG